MVWEVCYTDVRSSVPTKDFYLQVDLLYYGRSRIIRCSYRMLRKCGEKKQAYSIRTGVCFHQRTVIAFNKVTPQTIHFLTIAHLRCREFWSYWAHFVKIVWKLRTLPYKPEYKASFYFFCANCRMLDLRSPNERDLTFPRDMWGTRHFLVKSH